MNDEDGAFIVHRSAFIVSVDSLSQIIDSNRRLTSGFFSSQLNGG